MSADIIDFLSARFLVIAEHPDLTFTIDPGV